MFKHSYKPLRKVKIVAKETMMATGRTSDSWGVAQSVKIWEAFPYAIIDGVERLDTRSSIMFDLTEERLRQKCRREGYVIV